MEYLTSVMRGEHSEQTFISRCAYWEQEKTNIDVGAKDRINIAELLGKRYSMWTDRVDMFGNIVKDCNNYCYSPYEREYI